ncbi:MAG: hypothetical protein QW075_01275 [Thermofilaceae archaeon]
MDEFSHYVEYLTAKGLRIEAILYSDWLSSIATFDENFKRISWIKTLP